MFVTTFPIDLLHIFVIIIITTYLKFCKAVTVMQKITTLTYFRLMMSCEYFRYCIVSYTEGKIIQSVSISYIMSQIKEIESETIIIFA